mmetsp:Transcript_24085/g.59523  ORF Transcript_24085/g.59523 Transcript_24085/m.59523 type:complete len:202 (+) Transcript_24085:341-946(+)
MLVMLLLLLLLRLLPTGCGVAPLDEAPYLLKHDPPDAQQRVSLSANGMWVSTALERTGSHGWDWLFGVAVMVAWCVLGDRGSGGAGDGAVREEQVGHGAAQADIFIVHRLCMFRIEGCTSYRSVVGGPNALRQHIGHGSPALLVPAAWQRAAAMAVAVLNGCSRALVDAAEGLVDEGQQLAGRGPLDVIPQMRNECSQTRP